MMASYSVPLFSRSLYDSAMRVTSLLCGAVLVSVVLGGAGCRKPSISSATLAPQEGVDAFIPPPVNETEEQAARRELREILSRFRDAKTFRAAFTLETKDGPVTGRIDVMKPDRFHGVVTAPKDGKTDTSEVIGVSRSFYIKLGPDVWTYVKNEKQAALLTKAFRSAADGNTAELSSVIPDTAKVERSTNPTLSCRVYTTTITDAAGATSKLSVCASNGLPKRIEVFPQEGSVTIDYTDFNAMFVIERPLGIRYP